MTTSRRRGARHPNVTPATLDFWKDLALQTPSATAIIRTHACVGESARSRKEF
jgi:hypothetical protein